MNATHYFHGVKIPGRVSRYSVWFKGDPRGDTSSLSVVVDGERFDRAGRCYPLTAAEIDALTNGPWSASNWGVFNGVS
jgi:hypothetical protein